MLQNLFNLSLQQVMEETAKSILARVPKPFDIGQVMEKHPVVYEESMNTVLQQEVKLPEFQMEFFQTAKITFQQRQKTNLKIW